MNNSLRLLFSVLSPVAGLQTTLTVMKNKILLLAEKVFAVISYVHFSGGPLLLMLSGGISEGDEGDDSSSYALINVIFSIIYLIALALMALRWRKAVAVILKGRWIWALLILTFLSFFWSAGPDITRTRIVAMTGTMIFATYITSRYDLKEQLQLLGWTFGTIVVASLLFGVLLPKFGQMGGVHAGAWRGIFNHKNVLGKMMVPSAIVFALLSFNARKQQWVYWGFLATSILLILLSRASSPLLNLMILIGILIAAKTLHWRYLFMVPALIGVAAFGTVIYALLTSNAGQVAGAFGKDLTLTGRTNFWPLMLDKIWDNPWLGYGFGAFWQGLDGPSAYIWNASTFKAPNGHNGYLDLCLELGLIGFSIYLIQFITSFSKSLNHVRLSQTADGFWPTMLFCYIILANLTESSLMLQNNFLWIMQVSTFLSLDAYRIRKREYQLF
jgi:exopolysaccharide production protein ExoQ